VSEVRLRVIQFKDRTQVINLIVLVLNVTSNRLMLPHGSQNIAVIILKKMTLLILSNIYDDK